MIAEALRENKRFNNRWNADQNRGHDINGFSSVGIAVFKGKAFVAQAVKERSIAFIMAVRIRVEKSGEFLTKTFKDNDHHILFMHMPIRPGDYERPDKYCQLPGV